MAGITLAQAETRLNQYLEAEQKVLANQSYEILGRRMTKANLAEIQEGIRIWDERCKTLAQSSSGGRRVVVGRPC
jgi:hypothetical protein